MIAFFLYTALVFGDPQIHGFVQQISDTTKTRGQIQDFFRNTPTAAMQTTIDKLFGNRYDAVFFVTAMDSMLTHHPQFRNEILRLLIVRTPPQKDLVADVSRTLFEEDVSRFQSMTALDKMSIYNKRYALFNMNDKSIKAHQVDILLTIRWLRRIFGEWYP